MSDDCGKRYGPRRLICVRIAGHWGKHSNIRSAKGIGAALRKPSSDVVPALPPGVKVTYRTPSTPEQVDQTAHGPRVKGYCSECQGPMEQAVSGVSWHDGPCCHWHEHGTDCCHFIPLPAP